MATGTRPRELQISGNTLPQIRYLRTIKDVDFLKNKITQNINLLIIGAGYIGLEVAASATMRNTKVTIIESTDRVLSRVTGKTISNFYYNLHTSKGVKIQLNSTITEFESLQKTCIASSDNGYQYKFDLAIVGIGVIPNISIAEASALKCDNGLMGN